MVIANNNIVKHGPKKLGSLKSIKFKIPADTGPFLLCDHKKWLIRQILGGKTVQNVQIDLQTMEICSKKINVPWVSGGLSLWHLSYYREAQLLKIIYMMILIPNSYVDKLTAPSINRIALNLKKSKCINRRTR